MYYKIALQHVNTFQNMLTTITSVPQVPLKEYKRTAIMESEVLIFLWQ